MEVLSLRVLKPQMNADERGLILSLDSGGRFCRYNVFLQDQKQP